MLMRKEAGSHARLRRCMRLDLGFQQGRAIYG